MLRKGEIAPPFPGGKLRTFEGEFLDLDSLTEKGFFVMVFLRGFS